MNLLILALAGPPLALGVLLLIARLEHRMLDDTSEDRPAPE